MAPHNVVHGFQSAILDENGHKKKRGRRKLEDDQYYAITNDKIQEWE